MKLMRIDEIKNQDQYDRQTANLAMFDNAIREHKSSKDDTDLHPLIWQVQLDALQSVRDEIETRMVEWEKKLT